MDFVQSMLATARGHANRLDQASFVSWKTKREQQLSGTEVMPYIVDNRLMDIKFDLIYMVELLFIFYPPPSGRMACAVSEMFADNVEYMHCGFFCLSCLANIHTAHSDYLASLTKAEAMSIRSRQLFTI